MILLTVAEIIKIHEKLIAATGGSPGIRDAGLLESAVLGCYQSFGGIDLYPTIINKSARMAFAICKNHPFVDGNKRVAAHKGHTRGGAHKGTVLLCPLGQHRGSRAAQWDGSTVFPAHSGTVPLCSSPCVPLRLLSKEIL